ncbi:class I SAM-dependent methyltransferase [Aquabacterium sp. OR-4]|uniref:class I SAM-dependent methyltransferase n=1 Tax=Aquabacterium sp. OR-4 TaxID=2978127 RepID=UPI0021B27D50|nr:class I SAM-dependent methyltransferase [Aquabacterium sp. OR-4]MDT7836662.1 class I SAM-dependent methyltransferase [Aquabacterium sp. OR-4]
MTRLEAIIELGHWWQSPPGRYLLAWEQRQLDALVNDLFGFHALQLGLPQLEALRANRMPHRWLATEATLDDELPPVPLPPVDDALSTLLPQDSALVGNAALLCDFDALPFPAQSLDLVVLPHALELARDPHDTLREVERVLRPEGRALILGFNPASLWGLRQRAGHLRQRLGIGGPLYLPQAGEFIGFGRVRDWLRLLGFEVEYGRFGCWRPPLRSEGWLEHWRWMEGAGQRAWPVLGAVYAVQAVKRVRGMRLVGLARRRQVLKGAAPAVVAQRQPHAPQRAGARPLAAPAHGPDRILEMDGYD